MPSWTPTEGKEIKRNACQLNIREVGNHFRTGGRAALRAKPGVGCDTFSSVLLQPCWVIQEPHRQKQGNGSGPGDVAVSKIVGGYVRGWTPASTLHQGAFLWAFALIFTPAFGDSVVTRSPWRCCSLAVRCSPVTQDGWNNHTVLTWEHGPFSHCLEDTSHR